MDSVELTEAQRKALRGAWKRTLERRRSADPASHFPWHRQQEWIFEAPGLIENPVRIILIVGGNRSGKSKAAMGLMSDILRRQSPLNDQLLTTDKWTGDIRVKDERDPLNFWIIPPTGEKFRNDWVAPADGMGIKYWLGDRFVHSRQNPDYIFYSKTPGLDPRDAEGSVIETNCDRILGKSQDQDLLTFEASEVDVAIFDEEPPNMDIVTSTLMRVATSNGVLVFAFTPIRGLSWSYERWWKPLVKMGRAEKVGERRYVYAPADKEVGGILACQMAMGDNPRARVYAKEVRRDPEMTDAEKAARIDGEYGYVEGALLKRLAGIDLVSPTPEHEIYIVDDLPDADVIEDWYLVADPNKSYGALLGCQDVDGNLFIVAEHLEVGWPNRLHVKRFQAMERKYATGDVYRYADPGSAGSQAQVDLEDFGMYFDNVPKGAGSVSRTIKRVRGLAYVDPTHVHPITGEKGAPRIYFYAPGLIGKREKGGVAFIGSQLTEQISQAKQKEGATPDTPDKESHNLDLFDCLRYMAEVARTHGPSDDHKKRRKIPKKDRLDSKNLRSRRPDSMFGKPFDVPEYDFSHYN